MNKTTALFGCLGIFALVALISFFWGQSTYNGLVDKQEEVEKRWSQVRNVYQRRFDLIPNLVETVKGAANFEKSTLTEIAEMRSRVGQLNVNEGTFKDPQALQNFMQSQQALSSSIGRLMVVAENYPDLKASQNFRDLQVQLEGTENRISTERMKFNEAVKEYNTSVRKFPGNIFAGIFGFDKIDYFEGEQGIDKAPKVKF